MDFNELSKQADELLKGTQLVHFKLSNISKDELNKNPEFQKVRAQLNQQLENLQKVINLSNDTSSK